jgi:Family of unknown function (DUF6163)
MSEPRTDDAIKNIRPVQVTVFDWAGMDWAGRLALFLRVMGCVSMIKGLYAWAQVCGIIGDEGGFEAHIQSWQVTTAYFAVIDLVAAVGLWLLAPWGAVVWLTSTVSLIVVQVFLPQVYGTNIFVIALCLLAIVAYLGLALMAAREQPR